MNIGGSIRKIRLKSGLTQQEVADRCELSKAMISKVENGAVVPAVATLQRIARVLGVKVGELLEAESFENAKLTLNPFSNPEGFIRTAKGYQLFTGSNGPGQKMQPILIYAKKGELKPHQVVHQGEEYIYVVEGEMVFAVGETQYLLRKGDSLYFDGALKHGIQSVDHEVRYLNVFAGYEFSASEDEKKEE